MNHEAEPGEMLHAAWSQSLYNDLREMAARELRQDRNQGGLEPTELVHECYLKLAGWKEFRGVDRATFLAAAAVLIRRALVDQARSTGAQKRGEGRKPVTLREDSALTSDGNIDLLALDEALQRLAGLDPRQCRIVELRFFGGMTAEEVGGLLGVSRRTVTEEWRYARAWLRKEIG